MGSIADQDFFEDKSNWILIEVKGHLAPEYRAGWLNNKLQNCVSIEDHVTHAIHFLFWAPLKMMVFASKLRQ